MKMLAQAKHLWRKFSNYVRYDFKEIVFPSSLPDPPGTKKPQKLTWNEHILVWKVAGRLYLKSFKTPDIDIEEEIELIKNPDKAKSKKEEEKKAEPREPSTIEDLAVAARAGSEHIRPALQRIYMTKASAYKDALKNFVEGYQEGLRGVLNAEHTNKSESENFANTTKVDSSDISTREMKPGDKATESKPDDKVTEMKPNIKATELKPDAKATELKPDTKEMRV